MGDNEQAPEVEQLPMLWVFVICPRCNGPQMPALQIHSTNCPNRLIGARFEPRQILVAPAPEPDE